MSKTYQAIKARLAAKKAPVVEEAPKRGKRKTSKAGEQEGAPVQAEVIEDETQEEVEE
jgi:hypothetical protein